MFSSTQFEVKMNAAKPAFITAAGPQGREARSALNLPSCSCEDKDPKKGSNLALCTFGNGDQTQKVAMQRISNGDWNQNSGGRSSPAG